jgi:Toprim domain-containing protein
MSADLRAIARTLGGKVSGRNQISIPGPGHSSNDRSLSVRIEGDQVLVHSHAGDDWHECKEYVEGLLGWSSRPQTRQAPPVVRDDGDRSARARSLWDEARDPRTTAAERYLKSRSIPLTNTSALRFHHRCPWPGGERHPCLLAAFRDLVTDELVAVHRIRVDQPDLWPKTERAMLGPVRAAAVKIVPITDMLAVAEGVETALAASLLGHGPAWALGSAGAVERLPVLPGIERLILLAENNEASVRATTACGHRWLRAGRKATRVWPDRGYDDFNDELMAKGISK